jgi:hypothetical protein
VGEWILTKLDFFWTIFVPLFLLPWCNSSLLVENELLRLSRHESHCQLVQFYPRGHLILWIHSNAGRKLQSATLRFSTVHDVIDRTGTFDAQWARHAEASADGLVIVNGQASALPVQIVRTDTCIDCHSIKVSPRWGDGPSQRQW